jgi:ribonuclease HI
MTFSGENEKTPFRQDQASSNSIIMAKQEKYYVVWLGKKPGIYRNWIECKAQIEGVDGARYKSFGTMEEAGKAFKRDWKFFYKKSMPASTGKMGPRPTGDFIAVDAACSGNPGIMEYKGVFREPSVEIFHQGPFPEATNNIGEFLAIVHALALQTEKGTCLPVYSDSMNAISWIKKKKCGTKLTQTPANEALFNLIDRAENWLANHSWSIPLYKWETSSWGEIPADFGRK